MVSSYTILSATGTDIRTCIKGLDTKSSFCRTCKKYDKPVSIHLNSKGHSIDDFRFAGIEISRKNNTIYRQTCKSLFIKMCNTQQDGINKRK